MSKSIINLTNQDLTLSVLKEISPCVSYSGKNISFISNIQRFSPDSLDKLSIDLISQYENEFIEYFHDFLVEKYKFDESTDFYSSISHDSRQSTIVDYLLTFQKRFNAIKRMIKIKNEENYLELNKILSFYFKQLESTKDDGVEVKFEVLSDLPFDLLKLLGRKGFFGGRTTVSVKVTEHDMGFQIDSTDYIPSEYQVTSRPGYLLELSSTL